MQTERPYVLTIAGFDTSSGAGVTADLKTFEQLKIYGLAVCTAMTLQTEDDFISLTWRNQDEVTKETETLLKKYPVKAVKFGIVPSFGFLDRLADVIKAHDNSIKIVVDPIWKTSTGFVLNNNKQLSPEFLKKITLFTPNVPELKFLSNGKEEHLFIEEFVRYSNILVKGGHRADSAGIDTLYEKDGSTDITSFEEEVFPKHGSGCVLSAAVAAHLALGKDLKEACFLAKEYVEKFLASNKSLLGFHVT